MRVSIHAISAAFNVLTPVAIVSLLLLAQWPWFVVAIVAAWVVGDRLRCPVCGAYTTARWIDGDGPGPNATYMRILFVAPKQCGRCELDFRRHSFSDSGTAELIAKWNARHVH